MHYIETSSEYAEQAVTEALQEGQWLIGCITNKIKEDSKWITIST